jgi:hypothetical protein
MPPRLTLRVLLDYLDDTLKPADARDVGQQILESPVVGELISRIKRVTYRPSLPKISQDKLQKGDTTHEFALTANDVAEYLDTELPAERVADFERNCLARDETLAEVASVHQILSMGSMSQVASEKEVIDRLADRAASNAPKRLPPTSQPGPAARAEKEGSRTHELIPLAIPEYASSGALNKRLFLRFAAVAAFVTLALVSWLALNSGSDPAQPKTFPRQLPPP